MRSHPARSARLPKVVAVVLNWNGVLDTIECVESLRDAEHVPDHIVVCDNGSMDGSLRRLKEWASSNEIAYEAFATPDAAMASHAPATQMIFIENGENRGYAAGNNVGIRFALDRADADFIWILNNDAVVDDAALGKMLRVAASDSSIGIVGSTLLRYDEPDLIQALGGGHIWPIICHDTQIGRGKKAGSIGKRPIKVDHLVGASLLVRAAAIREAGLIDESYFLYREETDWCIRMRREGWDLYCCTDAIVWHKQARSIGFKSPVHDYYAVRNMLRLVRKFYPLSTVTAMGYFAMRSLLPKLFRFEFERARAVFSALHDFVTGIEGRSVHHTDVVLRHHYVGSPHAVAHIRPAQARRRHASART